MQWFWHPQMAYVTRLFLESPRETSIPSDRLTKYQRNYFTQGQVVNQRLVL